MYTLIFDTTGSGCNIALLRKDIVVDSFCRQMTFGQSETLIPAIKEILNTNGLGFSDLSAVFVCVGPGSFTGVRSSIAAARVFALADSSLKVGGISAFDAYIQSLSEQELSSVNAVIIETRRDDFYVAFYDKQRNKIDQPKAIFREDIITILKEKGGKVSVIGDGVERFLSTPSGLTFHSIKICDTLPLDGFAKACTDSLDSKKINYPKPLYLRAADVTLPKS